MKVMLKMFAGVWEMQSKIVCLPDKTGNEILLSLPSPVVCMATKWPADELAATFREIRCEFLFCGEHKDGVRIYILNRICGGKDFNV